MTEAKAAPLAVVESGDDLRPPNRLLSKAEVLDRVGVTYPSLWKWMIEGKFPRSRQLGGKVCWFEHEVDAWIAALPVARLKGDPTPPPAYRHGRGLRRNAEASDMAEK